MSRFQPFSRWLISSTRAPLVVVELLPMRTPATLQPKQPSTSRPGCISRCFNVVPVPRSNKVCFFLCSQRVDVSTVVDVCDCVRVAWLMLLERTVSHFEHVDATSTWCKVSKDSCFSWLRPKHIVFVRWFENGHVQIIARTRHLEDDGCLLPVAAPGFSLPVTVRK